MSAVQVDEYDGYSVIEPLWKACGAKPELQLSKIACEIKRVLIGQVKAGKTFGELQRMKNSGDNFFSIIVTINQIDSRNQTVKQAEEVGFLPENIIPCNQLRKQNNKYGSLSGKICIVSINETYDTRISDIIAEAHRQCLRINYTSDEYDGTGAILQLKSRMTRHDIENRWIQGLNKDDIFTGVSATNQVGFFYPWWTEIEVVAPWSPNYKGINDITIKTLDDATAEDLELGIVGDGFINRIKRENNSKRKALIKVTNRANYDIDNPKTHQELYDRFNEHFYTIMDNSISKFSEEDYAKAVVIIVGANANRTKEYKDIYTQYLDFGEQLCDASVIQSLRLCGAREYTPILYIPQNKRNKLEAAIESQNWLSDPENWKEEGIPITKENIPLPLKFAGQTRTKVVNEPTEIISEAEYTGILSRIYPMIDEINPHQSRGTRKYGDKDVNYVVRNVINKISKDRFQKSRNLVLPNSSGQIPTGVATSIRMGKNYDDSMCRFAAYYINPIDYSLKIALWDNIDMTKEQEELFSVETKSGAAA